VRSGLRQGGQQKGRCVERSIGTWPPSDQGSAISPLILDTVAASGTGSQPPHPALRANRHCGDPVSAAQRLCTQGAALLQLLVTHKTI